MRVLPPFSTFREAERLQPLLHPYPTEEITVYPLSMLVNKPANNTPSCMEPLRQD